MAKKLWLSDHLSFDQHCFHILIHGERLHFMGMGRVSMNTESGPLSLGIPWCLAGLHSLCFNGIGACWPAVIGPVLLGQGYVWVLTQLLFSCLCCRTRGKVIISGRLHRITVDVLGVTDTEWTQRPKVKDCKNVVVSGHLQLYTNTPGSWKLVPY